MANVNNKTNPRESGAAKGAAGAATYPDSREKTIPFPEKYTVKQGSMNGEMDLEPPSEGTDKDFLGPDYTNENKNPNNESFAKKGSKGTGVGLGEIGRLANNDKWGNVGN